MLTDSDSRDPLAWLSRILWPDGAATVEPIPPNSVAPLGQTWWASPTVSEPKVLIPAGRTEASRTAVRRYHDGFDLRLRLRSLAAEATMAISPLANRALGDKVVGVKPTPGHVGSPISPILDGIAEAMRVDELLVAFSLSSPKSNQKPVLQLLNHTGRCIGWAKVGWNDRTDALIGNEARWLVRSANVPLIKPDLVHDVDIAGRRVVITTGVRPSRRPRRSRFQPPAPALFSAVAELGNRGLADLLITETAWWSSVTDVLGEASERERRAIEGVVRDGPERSMKVGAWHGDLTPWNLMTVDDGVQLIDWEFAADEVPFGFDLCHFHTQVGAELRGLDADRALDRSARLSPQGLASLDVAPADRPMVWKLYLVELIRRHLALRSAGYPTAGVTQGPAALRRLERALGLTGSPGKVTTFTDLLTPAGKGVAQR